MTNNIVAAFREVANDAFASYANIRDDPNTDPNTDPDVQRAKAIWLDALEQLDGARILYESSPRFKNFPADWRCK